MAARENFSDCHFSWSLEPCHTTKDGESLLKQLDNHLKDNPDVMTIPALLFKSYIYVSDYMQNNKDSDSAFKCLKEAQRLIHECPDEDITTGYGIILHSLKGKIYGDILKNKPKEKEHKSKVKDLAKKNTDKSIAYIESVRAFALSRLGPQKMDECIECFEKAIKVCENNTQWLFGLALVYGRKTQMMQGMSLGETDRNEYERQLYQKIIDIDQSHALATLFLAEVYFREKKFKESNMMFARAIFRAPNSMKVRTRVAKFFRKLHLWAEAFARIEEAEKLEHTEPDAMLYHQKALIYIDKYKAKEGGQHCLPGETTEVSLLEMAIQALDKAIALNDLVFFGFDRAWVLEELQRDEDAGKEHRRLMGKVDKLWCADAVRVFLGYGKFLQRRHAESDTGEHEDGMHYHKQAIELAVEKCASEGPCGQKRFQDSVSKDIEHAISAYKEHNLNRLFENAKDFEALNNLGQLKLSLVGFQIGLDDVDSPETIFHMIYGSKHAVDESTLSDVLTGLILFHAKHSNKLADANRFLKELRALDEESAIAIEEALLERNISLCSKTPPQNRQAGERALIKDDTTGETSPSSDSQGKGTIIV